jgi:hypothetical protein
MQKTRGGYAEVKAADLLVGRSGVDAVGRGVGLGLGAGRRASGASRSRSRALSLALVSAVVSAAIGIGASPALATPATFDSGWGFDAAGLGGLPQVSIGASTPLLAAGESGAFPNLDVAFTGSTQICVLAPGSQTCRGANPPLTGPFSVLVSLTVDVLNPSVTGSFTLMLTSLVGGLGYTPSDVAIELSPAVPGSLNTSAVPGFVWNGGFTPFVRVHDVANAPASIYDYIGWTVHDGSTVTFRYDVLTGLKSGAYPKFSANVVPVVVPEPAGALLVGLGLALLVTGGGRSRTGD